MQSAHIRPNCQTAVEGGGEGRGKKVKIVYSAKILRFFFQSQKIDDVEKKIKAVCCEPPPFLKIESSPRDLTYLIYMMTLHSFINAICI